ncbi:sugar ABC transporter ATP-binding protein [Rhizobium leguminosarum]|uniref:ATP-binding cassette domain-containing protein n=1 Tax=Rhizobium TaxID=379 RepID=UPI001613D163|nr:MULTISPECIES: ATP-binding cassette domain-containing protein [Rhizobium]MBB3302458.1 simple sugar transport system ATP-binding protein/D-xylose transport system ATP-binding protein [Rhizobium sp. BK112]MBB3372131.1 simple sugar transport system ATP-binding protein/D-xylose transport system ATP-binding protein [Rhizobium sp. BK077]MBY5904249.1 sugar ABC transporter ATP-binding protein [Rhizobium leguminosarum]MBY5911618.1 sugar ABC transporter ATP-binding protein [Rhizobium leguminosarum]
MTATETGRSEQKSFPNHTSVPLVAMRNIQKSFGSVHALRGASVEVHAGEIVALVGDNGAGKSTLVKVMAGVYAADSGEFEIDGKPANIRTPADATKHGIATVYQDLALCNNLDAVQNLFLGRELTGPGWFGRRIRRAECEVRAREVMTRMRLGNLSLTRPVGAMSGGQRQNIAIARSILWTPKVVILDEPTAALSHSAAQQVADLIRGLADDGLGIVIVSHDIHHFVVNATDRIEVMRLGANAASFRSKDVTGEMVVNAMVGGNEGVNLAG